MSVATIAALLTQKTGLDPAAADLGAAAEILPVEKIGDAVAEFVARRARSRRSEG